MVWRTSVCAMHGISHTHTHSPDTHDTQRAKGCTWGFHTEWVDNQPNPTPHRRRIDKVHVSQHICNSITRCHTCKASDSDHRAIVVTLSPPPPPGRATAQKNPHLFLKRRSASKCVGHATPDDRRGKRGLVGTSCTHHLKNSHHQTKQQRKAEIARLVRELQHRRKLTARRNQAGTRLTEPTSLAHTGGRSSCTEITSQSTPGVMTELWSANMITCSEKGKCEGSSVTFSHCTWRREPLSLKCAAQKVTGSSSGLVRLTARILGERDMEFVCVHCFFQKRATPPLAFGGHTCAIKSYPDWSASCHSRVLAASKPAEPSAKWGSCRAKTCILSLNYYYYYYY